MDRTETIEAPHAGGARNYSRGARRPAASLAGLAFPALSCSHRRWLGAIRAVDLTPPISVSALERQLREGSGRLRFLPELESPFLAEHADSVVTRRLALIVAGVILVGIAPVLNALVLHPPAAFNDPALVAQFGVMIPSLVIAGIVTATPRLRRFQDPVSTAMAFVVTAGLLYERHIGAAVHFAIPIDLVSVVLLGTAVLAGLRTAYCVPLVFAIVAAFGFNEIATFGASADAFNAIAAMAMMAVLAAIGSYMEERSARAGWLQRRLLGELAVHDALSGLSNGRAFQEAYPRLHAAAARAGKPLLVAMLDIDWFKAFNDRYGHLAGDQCLRRVAQVLARHARRATDIQARVGGEEFALVWYDVRPEHAAPMLEAVRADVERLRIPHEGASAGPRVVTVSVGAVCRSAADSTAEAQLEAADDQLYRAKDSGRNRVVLAG